MQLRVIIYSWARFFDIDFTRMPTGRSFMRGHKETPTGRPSMRRKLRNNSGKGEQRTG